MEQDARHADVGSPRQRPVGLAPGVEAAVDVAGADNPRILRRLHRHGRALAEGAVEHNLLSGRCGRSAPDCPLRKFGIVRGNGHEARFSPFGHLSIIVIRLPDEQFSLPQIQDAQPVRFWWHAQRVEERLRFHRCSGEIVGGYRNSVQCRVRLVARPRAKELDGKIHHETLSGLRQVYHGNGRLRASI